MFLQTVIFLTFTVICVNSLCDQRCQLRQYTRVKRGKFYSNSPIKFYNPPPFSIPIKGPFSYTPPPYMVDNKPHYTRISPYKVSKRPISSSDEGLSDDDIANLVKHMSKQDLDKILEFAEETDQVYNKYKDGYDTYEYTKPYKRESKIVHKGNIQTTYEEATPQKEFKLVNYVAVPSHMNAFSTQIYTKPSWLSSNEINEKNPFDTEHIALNQRVPNESTAQSYITSQNPVSFVGSNNQVTDSVQMYFSDRDPVRLLTQIEKLPPSQIYNSPSSINYPVSNNPYFIESNEEDKLPLPDNMRDVDFEVSYTNNVPKVTTPDSDSYDIKNFSDLPLMDYYDSKLHDVSSYHVPHYTVIQPNSSKLSNSFAPFMSFSSSSSSSLLKLSPSAAAIEEPIYEPAPPISAAAEQSDAHLKAIKIWSHKSKGAAYTLHDDGTLTPEGNRPK